MPGITGIIGSRANAASLLAMCSRLNHFSYVTEQYNTHGISLARVHCGYVNRQPQPVFSADKRYACVMIGEIFSIDGLPSSPAELDASVFLDQFITGGLDLLPKINGQYSACIFDVAEQTAYLVSDRYGSRPVYYAIDGDSLYFAPETKALPAAGIHSSVNYPAFSDLFHFGHLFGHKTLFEGIAQLPDASVLIFKQGRLRIESYWDFPFDEASYSEEKQSKTKYKTFKEQLKNALGNAVNRQVAKNSGKLLIPLSGGLDSRFVAALAKGSVNAPVETFTMGGPRSEELRYGAQVANMLGFPHRAFDTQPSDIWESAPFFSYIADGMSPIYGPIAIHKPCLHYRQSAEILLAPQMCDTLFGSTLQRRGVKQLRSNPGRSTADTILTDFYSLIGEESLQLIFTGDFYRQYIRDHWKTVPQQYIEQYRHPLHCYFMLLHKEHGRRYILSGNLLYNLYYDTRMPSYDNDLIDLAFHIPLPFKINQDVYRFAFAEMFPELAEIRREGTHLPVNAPGYIIDMLRLRDKFLVVAQQLPVAWKIAERWIPPSYNSFNQWFKFDLREKLHAFLLDKKTLDRGIFDRNGVEALLRLHDKPTEDHSRLLWQMVNLEYFFRNFID
jgi:asparagine synthase (glutamine-hydrolysing)